MNHLVLETKDKEIIYTSIYPINFITKRIVGDNMEVRNIIPVGVESHGWEPKLKDIADISDAKLVLINGLSMESWIDKISNIVKEEKIIEINNNIDLIEIIEKNRTSYDPHIWLSPKNMLIIAENIFNEIIRIDEKNREYYEINYNKLKDELLELDAIYKNELNKYNGRGIIVPHEAFGYLTRDYNLIQIPIENINSSIEPDLKTIASIIDIAKERNINTVFYEYGESQRLSEMIANEINGKIKVIYTLENISKNQNKNNDNYISLMYENLKNIVESFKDE